MAEAPLPFDEQRPETLPAYEFVVRAEGALVGTAATIGVKNTGLDVYLDGGVVAHYDLQGRLLRVADPPLQWRRGLSHRTLQLRRCDGGGFETRLLDDSECDALLDRMSDQLRPIAASIRADRCTVLRCAAGTRCDLETLDRLVQSAASFDSVGARADAAAFQRIYGDVPILPPDQYNALALMATDGCHYNRCTFCGFYRKTRYRRKDLAEFQQHVQEAIKYHGMGLTRRRGIFLGQANALIGDADWRASIFRIVNSQFEFPADGSGAHGPSWWRGSVRRFVAITAFLDAFSGVNISARQFAALRALNLRRVLIGMESGDIGLLRWLKKPGTPDQILKTVRTARAGGVKIGVIVLIGAGGARFAEDHIQQTVRLIRAMQLESGDYVYLSPLVHASGTEYTDRAAREGIRPLGSAEMAEQERRMRAGLAASPTRNGPYVAHYEVAHFIY